MSSPDAAMRFAKAILAFRRARADELPVGLFSETAWEFLLELFIADGEGLRLTGREIARRSDASESTASRWLKHLSSEGLVVGDGEGDLDDQLTLSATALDRMEALLGNPHDFGDMVIDRYRSDEG